MSTKHLVYDIFFKIEIFNISKEDIKLALKKYHSRKVRYFPEISKDEETFKVFKNWLHPRLKHIHSRPNLREAYRDPKVFEAYNLWFYENGQFQFRYTLEDILNYIGVESLDVL